MEKNLRWVQRLSNYTKAIHQLSKFINKEALNELEEQGLIQAFEYTYELAWNTIKDFYENQGESQIQGSRDAIRLAFQRGLIVQGDIWMNMIKSRILTSHTYNEDITRDIVHAIHRDYYQELVSLHMALTHIHETNKDG